MADDPTTPTESAPEPAFDMESAVTEVGESLFKNEPADPDREPADSTGESRGADDEAAPEKIAEAPVVRNPPKSWAKEQHERWGNLDPAVQDYIDQRENQMSEGVKAVGADATFGRALREVITPHKALIAQQGVDEVRAVQFLLNAHSKLSMAPREEKMELLNRIAKSYGIDLAQPDANAAPVDPAFKALQDRLEGIESNLSAREQAALQATKTRVGSEVEAFAQDPAHPYFDEVADDIALFVKSGMELDDAYDKAVWSNPITRAKELERTKAEQEKKLRENSRLDALPKIKASAANVRSRDTNRAPTEPLGTWEDSLRSQLAVIKQRPH